MKRYTDADGNMIAELSEEEVTIMQSIQDGFRKRCAANTIGKEAVNHPSHYAEGRKYEPIDVIEDWGLGFCLGNTVKYISRAGRKNNAVEDLKKALWYLQREVDKRMSADV